MRDDFKIYVDANSACKDLVGYLRLNCFKTVGLVTGQSSFEKSGASSWLPVIKKSLI